MQTGKSLRTQQFPRSIDEHIFTHTDGPSVWVYDPKSLSRFSSTQSKFPKFKRPEVFPGAEDFALDDSTSALLRPVQFRKGTPVPTVARHFPRLSSLPVRHASIPRIDDRTMLSVVAADQADRQRRKSKPRHGFPKQRRPELFKESLLKGMNIPGPADYDTVSAEYTRPPVPAFDRSKRGLLSKPKPASMAPVGTYSPVLPPKKISHGKPKLRLESWTLDETRKLVNSAILPGPGSYEPFKASSVVTEAKNVSLKTKTLPFRLPHPYNYNSQHVRPRRRRSVSAFLDKIVLTDDLDVDADPAEDVNTEFDHPEGVPLWVKVQRFLGQSTGDGRTDAAVSGKKRSCAQSKGRTHPPMGLVEDLERTLTDIEETRMSSWQSIDAMLRESGEILVKKAQSRAKIDGLDDKKSQEMVGIVRTMVDGI